MYGLVARDVGISPNDVEEMYVDRLEDVIESWNVAPPASISAAIRAGTYKPDPREQKIEMGPEFAKRFGGQAVKRGG